MDFSCTNYNKSSSNPFAEIDLYINGIIIARESSSSNGS
jgi:hypothetical protein